MSDIRYWLGFNLVPGIGPSRLRALLDYFGDLEPAWRANAATLSAVGLPRNAVESLVLRRSDIDLDAELAKVEAQGLHILTWDSPDYPPLLQKIDSPPPLLYVRGHIVPEDEWAVAVVGTRKVGSYGDRVTRNLVGGLAENGITVVSGLALGVDSIAHCAALEASGRTLAVLGCGLDIIYPPEHRELADQISRSGALISDYPLGTPPEGVNFPPRNRIISGLSLGTLVVEAPLQSGALITLRYALEQGRETFAVPGNIYSRASTGTNAAIQRGEAKLVTQVEDILEELNLTMVVEHSEARAVVPETPTEKVLLDHIGVEPIHMDEIVRKSGLPTATVTSTLVMMELKGMVRRVDNASYVVAH